MPHVVLTGTESTYKTRLCEALSEWLNVRSVPEYAREYMQENKLDVTALNEAVFTTIATGQIEQLRSNGYYDVHAAPLLFDTDSITLAVWAADKFQRVYEEFTVVPQHLHYLLCAPTNRAYADPLREDLTRRDVLHQRYIDMLDAVNASYTILNEVAFEDRLLEAKSALKSRGFIPRD